MTVAVDMETRRVVYAVPGKEADTIGAIGKHLESKGCEKIQIKQTYINMSPAFISGILDNFEKASITFDKFQMVKIIDEAINEVRNLERKEFDMLKGYKYIFLKNDRKLSDKAKEAKYHILMLFPNIANA